MDIKQLKVFACVVETRSFSKAGQLLHLTQPTISSHIASLEKELNIKLIVRTTKETYPSEAGMLLYNYATDILSRVQEATDAISRFSQEMRGSITVAASTIPGQYFLPGLIQNFRQKYPNIKFSINMVDSAEVSDRVASRDAEIGFTGTAGTSAKCVYREFAYDKLVVITPYEQRYLRYQTSGFPVRRILKENFISREAGSGTRKETELFLKEMGIDPADLKTAVEVRSTETIKKMVSEGLGVAILSQSACEDYCQFKKVMAFDFSDVPLRRKLYLVKHKSSFLSPIAQVFYDYSKNYFLKN